MNKFTWIAMMVTLLSRAGFAQGPGGPPDELSRMKFLVGTWKCTGKMLATPLGPEGAAETVMTVQTKADEFWYSVRYETKTQDGSPPSKGVGMIGFDPGSKALAIISMESSGVTYSQRSPGFIDNKAEWTGEMSGMGKKVPYRETYVKKSDTELSTFMELSLKKGAWIKASELACKRN